MTRESLIFMLAISSVAWVVILGVLILIIKSIDWKNYDLVKSSARFLGGFILGTIGVNVLLIIFNSILNSHA